MSDSKKPGPLDPITPAFGVPENKPAPEVKKADDPEATTYKAPESESPPVGHPVDPYYDRFRG